MYFWTLLFLSASVLFAADEQRLALAASAKADFERVAGAATPELRDASRCVQSQASLLSVALPAEAPLAHFRKGYCTLAGAATTGSSAEFQEAAGEFARALEMWPSRAPRGKLNIPEPVPSGLRVLLAISRLRAGPDAAGFDRARQELEDAVQPAVCNASLAGESTCQMLVSEGGEWLGWIAIQKDRLWDASRYLAAQPQSAWAHWAKGILAFRDKRYADAAAEYQSALSIWTRTQRESVSFAVRLQPQPDIAESWADLGGAELLAGRASAAIPDLDNAIRANSNLAQAIYLRGRAKEALGQTDAAMADYSLASRTAFATAQDLASGEAHLYRGVLFYRRKEFARAEDEFSSALNFAISPLWRPDASAWRHMAAVASGSCAASRTQLEDALAQVSPYFPKDEARKLAGACPLTSSRNAAGF